MSRGEYRFAATCSAIMVSPITNANTPTSVPATASSTF